MNKSTLLQNMASKLLSKTDAQPKEILDLAKNHLKELPWTSSWKSSKLKRLDVPCRKFVRANGIWRWDDITWNLASLSGFPFWIPVDMTNWCFFRLVEHVELMTYYLQINGRFSNAVLQFYNAMKEDSDEEGRRIQLERQLVKP